MNPSQQALYDQLLALAIDEPGVEQTFAQRLARENNWSQPYADRVVVEYKKFLLLSTTSNHVVCPSEQVDQAWHLHLTYTRSYWDDLCRRVLNRPLHHSPTKGGREELTKFVGLYDQTLASYRKIFGQSPPADIWSPAHQRFCSDARHITVNTDRHWIIPKPRLPRRLRPLSRNRHLLACGLLAFPLAATWNLLDWKGPDFLGAYAIIAVSAAFLAWFARVFLYDSPAETALDDSKPLDHYEVACLAAGPQRTVQAAFAAMVQAKTLELAASEAKVMGILRTSREIRRGEPLSSDAPPIEKALYDAALVPAQNLRPLFRAGLPVAKEINSDLQRRGLVNSALPSIWTLAPFLIMATPLFIAVPKLILGMQRGRPVGFLIAAVVVTAVAAFLFLAKPRLTRLGSALFEKLKRDYATTADMVRTSPPQTSTAETGSLPNPALSPANVALAIGLFGAGMLAAGPLSNVYAMLPRHTGGGGCGGGGCSTINGGCGSGCSGGSGCGGGGCGGGGCGGCGGGGD